MAPRHARGGRGGHHAGGVIVDPRRQDQDFEDSRSRSILPHDAQPGKPELEPDLHAPADSGYIAKRTIKQLYDPVKAMFLPDRYIKGECPNWAGRPVRRQLRSWWQGVQPDRPQEPALGGIGRGAELRDSEHYFFELGKFEAWLRVWL
jgi:hypothetical protein